MKKILVIILIMTLVLSGYKLRETGENSQQQVNTLGLESYTKDSSVYEAKADDQTDDQTDDQLDIQTDESLNTNDLVYHDYGSGIHLSAGSKLIIKKINLHLQDETAVIYAFDLEKDSLYDLGDYEPEQDITYTPDAKGVYQIIAVLSNGKVIDLTPDAIVETSGNDLGAGGFIPLQ